MILAESHCLFPFLCLLKLEGMGGFSCHCGKTPRRYELKEKDFSLAQGSEGTVLRGGSRL